MHRTSCCCSPCSSAQFGIAVGVVICWAIVYRTTPSHQQGAIGAFAAVFQVASLVAIATTCLQAAAASGQLASSEFVWRSVHQGEARPPKLRLIVSMLSSARRVQCALETCCCYVPPPERRRRYTSHRTTLPPMMRPRVSVQGFGLKDARGYFALTGLVYSAFAFVGQDTSAVLTEETRRPHRVAPRALLLSVSATGALGLLYTLALLYSIPSLDFATPADAVRAVTAGAARQSGGNGGGYVVAPSNGAAAARAPRHL